MKVPLKKRRETPDPPGWQHIQWTTCLPFFVSSRAMLTHRVESVTTIMCGRGAHYAVHYLCNGQTTASGVFTDDPPANRLLCAACEAHAKSKGKPSADELTGRHVHVGRIRVERTCCEHTN